MTPAAKRALALIRKGWDPLEAFKSVGYSQPARELKRHYAAIQKLVATRKPERTPERPQPLQTLRRIAADLSDPAAALSAAIELIKREPAPAAQSCVLTLQEGDDLEQKLAEREAAAVRGNSTDRALALDTIAYCQTDACLKTQVAAAKAELGLLEMSETTPTALLIVWDNGRGENNESYDHD
jgi:hypothetical protein